MLSFFVGGFISEVLQVYIWVEYIYKSFRVSLLFLDICIINSLSSSSSPSIESEFYCKLWALILSSYKVSNYKPSKKISIVMLLLDILAKNFWAWDLAYVLVLVATCSSTFFQFFPWIFNASKNLTCSTRVHLPFFYWPSIIYA